MQNLSLHGHVQSARHFVTEQHLRANHQATRNAKALTLTAREFMRELVHGTRRQRNSVQEFPRPLAGFVKRKPSGNNGSRQYFRHRLARVQAAERVLKNHLHQVRNANGFLGRIHLAILHRHSKQTKTSLRNRNKPDQGLHKRRFSTAGLPHNRKDLTLRKRKRDIVNSRKIVLNLAKNATANREPDRQSVHFESRDHTIKIFGTHQASNSARAS